MNSENVFYTIIGYLFFTLVSSDTTGGDNKFDCWISEIIEEEVCLSLKFEVERNVTIHIHHWIVLFLMFLVAEEMNYSNIKYMCLGGIAQGIISYTDWYNIILFN